MQQWIEVLWKTAFFYFLLLVLLRVTGKREIHALSAIDLVGFIMISEVAIISIADGSIPMYVGVTPVVLLGLLELGISYVSLKSRYVRFLVEGQASIVIDQGKLNKKALRSLRYNLHDLLAELRSMNIPDVADVEYAILEPTGKLSVVPKPSRRPVTGDDLQAVGLIHPPATTALPRSAPSMAVVVDGEVDDRALSLAGQNRDWLLAELSRQGHDGPKGILLATVNAQGQLKVHPQTEEHVKGGSPPETGHTT